MLTVSAKIVGKRGDLVPPRSMELPPRLEEAGVTLRSFISHVVMEEVKTFRERREERKFLRVLTEKEIQENALRGKVSMGGSEIEDQPVDEEQAVATALQAFEDGLYYVFIDDEQYSNLDGHVPLKQDSRATFIRLVALVGG